MDESRTRTLFRFYHLSYDSVKAEKLVSIMSITPASSSPPQDEGEGIASARRTPVQGRSQETVQRILHATSRLLERIPLEEITTSRIAQESGVSVGGLYRFFPDKQAIVDAIAVQHVKEFESQVRSKLLRRLPLNGTKFLNAVIDSFVAFLDERPDFRTIVFGRHISAATREQQIRPDLGAAGLVKQALALLFGIKDSAKLAFKIRIASETGERLLAYAYEQENAKERQRVIDELKVMLASYLFR
ncbi:MAG TPA: TetR/AcrR family transcriptional regulator [Bryobacteraceae bacterium]|jgi:AcrR family transcriptional regulator